MLQATRLSEIAKVGRWAALPRLIGRHPTPVVPNETGGREVIRLRNGGIIGYKLGIFRLSRHPGECRDAGNTSSMDDTPRSPFGPTFSRSTRCALLSGVRRNDRA
jgi:hypothetical protein